MNNPIRPSSGNGARGRRFPLSKRTLAILIMVAGAAAFVYSRVAYGGQILCLMGSTLIVFVGLAIWLSARNPNLDARINENNRQEPIEPHRPVFRRTVPRGLRDEVRRRTTAPAPPPVQPQPPELPVDPVPIATSSMPQTGALLGQVIALLDQQEAQVEIETQREDAGGSRGILRVQSKDGLPYSLMVLEGNEPVDVADVRALFALVSSSGSAGGYLVASAPFTQRAYEWAGQRHIHLVREDELDEMSI